TQVAHIQFHNPAGMAGGTYPARMLATGEIVPASGAALPASMALSPQPGGMQVILQGEAGRVYSIETSTDLVHWSTWTNAPDPSKFRCCKRVRLRPAKSPACHPVADSTPCSPATPRRMPARFRPSPAYAPDTCPPPSRLDC